MGDRKDEAIRSDGSASEGIGGTRKDDGAMNDGDDEILDEAILDADAGSGSAGSRPDGTDPRPDGMATRQPPTQADLAVDDLRWLALVADAGGLSAAARAHDMPKASLSRAIGRLEDAAGAPLFDRVGRGLRLTPLGETLLPAARGAIGALRDAEEALRSATGEPAGPLRVAASALAAHKLVNGVIAELVGRHSAVRAELRVTSRPIDPLAEDYDVALHIGRPEQPQLVARRMLSAMLGLYAHPDALLGIDPTDPDEVLGRRGAGQSETAGIGANGVERIVMAIDALPRAWTLTHRDTGDVLTLDRPPAITVNDPTVALDIMTAGRGMALVPRLWAEPIAKRGDLVAVLPDWDGPTLDIFAVMPPRRATVPAVRAFLDLMFEHAKALRQRQAG